SREVRVHSVPADLTPREFALLEYLIRNAGRVIGKAELLDHGWGKASDVAPNAVEVYVGYLRRKIGNDRLITVRGVGYRLVAGARDSPPEALFGVKPGGCPDVHLGR